MIRVGILTVSDRSARGEREDLSGPALQQAVCDGWPAPARAETADTNTETAGQQSDEPEPELPMLVAIEVVPDDRPIIAAKLKEWCDQLGLDLILTTGGTGFSPRDVTPEATEDIVERHAPGLAEMMRAESYVSTRHAMLSRAVAGIRGRTLVVNLPGSPSGAVENLGFILPVLPHAIELLRGEKSAEKHHR